MRNLNKDLFYPSLGLYLLHSLHLDGPTTSDNDMARDHCNRGFDMMISEGIRLQRFHRMWQLSVEIWAVEVVEAVLDLPNEATVLYFCRHCFCLIAKCFCCNRREVDIHCVDVAVVDDDVDEDVSNRMIPFAVGTGENAHGVYRNRDGSNRLDCYCSKMSDVPYPFLEYDTPV